jgi:hypothetical protein
MQKSITPLIEKPFYVFGYGFVFLLYRTFLYGPSFNLLDAIFLFSIFCLTTIVFSYLIKKLFQPHNVNLIILISWMSLLHVIAIAGKLGFDYEHIPVKFYIYFYIATVLFIFLVDKVQKELPPQFNPVRNRFANIFLLILGIIICIQGAWNEHNRTVLSKEHNRNLSLTINALQHPGILWILMDEYGSSDVLQKEFQFQNPLDKVLISRGFILPDSIQSRSTSTLYSVYSVFNMNDSIIPSSFFAGKDLLNNASWVPFLEKNNYQFQNISAFDISHHPMLLNRSGYPQSYYDQVLAGSLFMMIEMSYRYTPEQCDTYNQLVIQDLNNAIPIKASTPRFIWAHIPIPHEPFTRNADGMFINTINENNVQEMKKGYTDYLQYGNTLLLKLLDRNPDLMKSIVIISGDHGPRFSFLRNRNNALSPFMAIHFPTNFDTASFKKIRYLSEVPVFINKYLESR